MKLVALFAMEIYTTTRRCFSEHSSTKHRKEKWLMKSYQILVASLFAALLLAGDSLANTMLFSGHGQPSEVVLDDAVLSLIERPRMNDSAEVVWTKQLPSTNYAIISSTRGEIASSAVTIRDPDINNAGEIIWRFGDGGAGPNGIQSNVRGTLLLSSSQDPNYDTPRINTSGEVIASRAGIPERLWSTTRGFISSVGNTIRDTEFNDAGEIVYMSAPPGLPQSIRSTVQGQLASSAFGAGDPDINGSGEIVWQQISGPHGSFPDEPWEIWSSVRGKLGSGQKPSINDAGEVVWQFWDGEDFELYSTIRGQLTSNQKMDTDPFINNLGDVAWLRSTESVPEPSMAILFGVASMIGWGLARGRGEI
jgi:hypothetical protein